MILNLQEKEILDGLMKNYNLPLGMGIVCLDFAGGAQTKNGTAYETYALGFAKYDTEYKSKSSTLIRSAILTPLKLIRHINYKLFIRSIEYDTTEEYEQVTVRLAVE